jgi:hypothetical protein
MQAGHLGGSAGRERQGKVSERSRKRVAAWLEFWSAQMAVSSMPWSLVEAHGRLAEYHGKIAASRATTKLASPVHAYRQRSSGADHG